MEIDGAVVTCGYITQWSQVAEASWFSLPDIMPVPLQFDLSAIVPMCIMFIVTAVETIGDTSGVVQGGFGREATDKEIRPPRALCKNPYVCKRLFSKLADDTFGINVPPKVP